MTLRDPFLISLSILLDRVAVFLILSVVSFMLLWSAVWERGLGLSWTFAFVQLQGIFSGQVERVIVVLFTLTLAVAVLGSGLLSFWLFARWRRRGELGASHLRGSHLEG